MLNCAVVWHMFVGFAVFFEKALQEAGTNTLTQLMLRFFGESFTKLRCSLSFGKTNVHTRMHPCFESFQLIN
eukprot:m.1086971 g.1086971  ORF g.1086971 m.1086971 type:complete len:72 (-) comp24281_c0_seq3:3458-3673(-)